MGLEILIPIILTNLPAGINAVKYVGGVIHDLFTQQVITEAQALEGMRLARQQTNDKSDAFDQFVSAITSGGPKPE